jgi:proteasome accessory factor A
MRERVFGIETEYALIYHPRWRGSPRPTNLQIYALFEQALHERVRSLPRALSLLRAKSGRFLENGFSFHYEATPEHYEHGLLEVASPECRDPFALLHCELAKDALVEELCGRVNAVLARQGFRGEVRVGKNNVDGHGHTFGSHESYWVEDALPASRRALLVALWLPLWLVTLPFLAWVLLLTPALLALGVALLAAWAAAGLALSLVAALLGGVRPAWGARVRALGQRAAGWASRRANAVAASPGELVRRLNVLVLPLFPVLELHSLLLRRFVLAPVRRGFTAHLVTRTIYTGAGAVAFDGGPLLRLAQRPPFLRELARIFTSGERRPIYEIRDLFFQPLGIFSPRRRLHLMIGDANLCEWAQVLRVGTSALVLEAIESGAPVAWPELADPLGALGELNADPDCSVRLLLRDGSRASPLELQHRYLAGVREALGPGPLADWKTRVLGAWQETLALLEHDPAALADRVDWIAKQQLLEAEIPLPADRDALRERGLSLLEGPAPDDPEERRLRECAFRARRVDLRYHELGARGGYRRLLERGAVRRLADADAVARARREPPADTRARARGRAIREAARAGRSGAATWHRVRAGLFDWRWFPDPLDPGPA